MRRGILRRVAALTAAGSLGAVTWWIAPHGQAKQQHAPAVAVESGLPAAARPGPLAVAQMFAVAAWAFDWRDPASLCVCRSLVTASLWSRLRTDPGAPAFVAQRRADREVDVVGSVAVAVEDRAPGAVGLTLSAPVTIQTVQSGGSWGGTVSGRRDMEVRVVDTLSGWRVAEVEI